MLSCTIRSILFKSILSPARCFSRLPTPVRYRAQSEMLITQQIDTPEYRSILTPSLLKLAELFRSHQHEIRIAGGAVRDLLMGIRPHDVDFATTATPDQVKSMLNQANIRMINANGEKHGTITARIDDQENFEVTTLRVDVVTDGRHAVVEFTKDWALDASRRDLTINALFLDLKGTVYDYFNGIEDLKHRRIRFVGDPGERIREDYLRILRYFRFFGRLAHDDAEHDPQTLDAIYQNSHGLKDISGERLWVELKRIAEGRNAGPVLKTMLEQNIGQYLGIPSKADLHALVEHWRQCHPSNPHALTVLMKLFRDMDEYNKFEKRMKYSNDCRRLAQLILFFRDQMCDRQLKSYKDLLIDLYLYDPDVKEKIIELLKYHYHHDDVRELTEWSVPLFPVSPGMLALKGIKQSGNYREILQQLREAWKQSDFRATETDLLNEILPRILKKEKSFTSKTIVIPAAFTLPKRKKPQQQPQRKESSSAVL